MEQKQLPMLSLTTSTTTATNSEPITLDRCSEESQKHSSSVATIDLAAEDVRAILAQQKERSQLLTTKLNILFVVNGALWTSLIISRLIFTSSWFSWTEILSFALNFTLLIDAFLPRQEAVSPNLEDTKFLERYLTLSPDQYQLQMMVNLVETYNANRQRIEDVSQSLTYAAYVTWVIALTIILHIAATYFLAAITTQ
jgi:hypothetical protein